MTTTYTQTTSMLAFCIFSFHKKNQILDFAFTSTHTHKITNTFYSFYFLLLVYKVLSNTVYLITADKNKNVPNRLERSNNILI